MKIDIAFLPTELETRNLSDTVCIILDIFRATSCIVTAFANGCQTLFPVLSLSEAYTLAETCGPVLLAGERRSLKLEGCQLGNSPFEFSKDVVEGKAVIMTTSNGTSAIRTADNAYHTFIGSFLNAEAVSSKARQYGKDILILCAGTAGTFSLEDTLCAGLLVSLLSAGGEHSLTDAAKGAFLMYKQVKKELPVIAADSSNGRRLKDLQRYQEIEYCLNIDRYRVVPQYKDRKIIMAE